jgi:hypothetical protein
MSRIETATSSNVTTTSVTAGSTILSFQTKSLAGSTRPRVKFMDGKVHEETLNVALAERMEEVSSLIDFLEILKSTFMYEKLDAFARWITSRMLMPSTTNALSGNTSVGGLARSNVKQVSRRKEANERGGQGVQKWSTLLALYELPLHGIQLVAK